MRSEEAAELIKSRIMPIFATRGRVCVAIDGRCASGKTTFAAALAASLGATVFHADDFFLRPEQRTAERLAEPGGNMDRERLEAEILIPLAENREVTYRPFDCREMKLAEPRSVKPSPIRIIEGSYTHHPELLKYYDFRVFLDTPPTLQWERILKREGETRAEAFRERWIPLEEKYLSAHSVREHADLVITLD